MLGNALRSRRRWLAGAPLAWALAGPIQGCDASNAANAAGAPVITYDGATTKETAAAGSAAPNPKQSRDSGVHYGDLSPQQRRRELAQCLRATASCDVALRMDILGSAADPQERASLEAQEAIRLATIQLLQVVTDREGPHARDDSAECNAERITAVRQSRVALDRVEAASARLVHMGRNPLDLPTLPGWGWLKEAELEVRWCADCSPKHGGRCQEARESLQRAQAAMDAAGW